jgi:DNA-binding response OmpR family regulator
MKLKTQPSDKRILVVDDEKEVRQLLSLVLRQRKYQTFEAADATVAMKMILDMDFDMIVSDVNMPVISGIELLQEVKRQQYGIPVLMLTGASRVEDAVECMKNGAVDFVTKPIDFELFTSIIEDTLNEQDEASVPPGPQRPRSLGRYTICDVLGEGNMGIVYLGEDDTGKEFAIKVLKSCSAADDKRLNRFYREVDVLAQLDHPNIVKFYDHGFDELEKMPYYAMERIHGQSLKMFCRGVVEKTVREKVHILRQVAAALTVAHRKRIWHRDIKPDNILVLPDLTVKLTDFGIAKVMDSELTLTGQFLGTPAYISPEGLGGEKVDGRADIYSLGAVGYELFLGQKLFDGRSIGEYIAAVESRRPVAPMQRDKNFPPVLQSVLAKALKKEASDRYSSAEHLVVDLDICLAAKDIGKLRLIKEYEDNDWE